MSNVEQGIMNVEGMQVIRFCLNYDKTRSAESGTDFIREVGVARHELRETRL